MQTQAFTREDLGNFRNVQRLAYDCVQAVERQLQVGMTEKDAVRLMREWLAAKGVTELFHDPFAWFGDRAAFKGFWADHKFFATGRKLEHGTAGILDVAPIVDGYSADIGYCFVHGKADALDDMDRVLIRCREQILADVKARKTFKQIYRNVDALIEGAGFANQHKRYPHRVIGHRIARFEKNPLNRIRWMGFGLPQYVALIVRAWGAKLFPSWVRSPLWNDRRESDHAPFVGLWAVEPHISLKDQSLGTKWEEILVITETDAWWLDDDVPHVRKAERKGWMKRAGAPARPVREREAVAALVC
jgi:hypothetical protein